MLLAVMAVVVPLVGPVEAVDHVWRAALYQGLGALLLAAVLVWPGARPRHLLGVGITPLVLLSFGWTALGVFRAPNGAFALNELLSMGAGGAVYLALVWRVESRDQLGFLCDALVLAVILALAYGLLLQSSPGEAGLSSSFDSRMMLGAYLALMTPFLTALALGGTAAPGSRSWTSGSEPGCRGPCPRFGAEGDSGWGGSPEPGAAADRSRSREILLRALASLCVVSLVLTQCRSAWAGGLIGLLCMGVLIRLAHSFSWLP